MIEFKEEKETYENNFLNRRMIGSSKAVSSKARGIKCFTPIHTSTRKLEPRELKKGGSFEKTSENKFGRKLTNKIGKSKFRATTTTNQYEINYEEIINSIQRAKSFESENFQKGLFLSRENPSEKKKKTTLNKVKQLFEKGEDKIFSINNTENVQDFYEYTENCMKEILTLPPKEKSVTPVEIIFKHPKKKLAVFDLDETLVHCTGQIRPNSPKDYQYAVEVMLPTNKKVQIGINIRPNWKKALDMIKKDYNIVLYTASHQSYTDAVLNLLDPKKEYFEYRLFRNNCLPVQISKGNFYIKDLSIFKNVNIKDIVIIDNSVLSFAYHLSNGIPIVPYYDAEKDNEMLILAYYLISIASVNDLRKANDEHIKINNFLEQARKEVEDPDTTNDDDDDSTVNDSKNKENYNDNIKLNVTENLNTVNRLDFTSIKTECSNIATGFKNTLRKMYSQFQNDAN